VTSRVPPLIDALTTEQIAELTAITQAILQRLEAG
jgi:hypothetical protein